jgi:transcriptional antiterminator RfaH
MTAAGIRWYVVQTQPNSEMKAAHHLMRQGFTAYLPRYLKRRRHARKVETVPAPLFPRYLFVAIDVTTQRWRSIQSTIGVSRLVCNGEEPAAVPPGIVEGIQTSEGDNGYVALDTRPKFAVGEKVRILDGAFAACLGLFERMSDGDRVAVLLELLGRKVRVVLDIDCVAAA